MSAHDAIFWKGKPAEDLTREEAVEAFKQTFRTLAAVMAPRGPARVESDTPIADAFRASRVRQTSLP